MISGKFLFSAMPVHAQVLNGALVKVADNNFNNRVFKVALNHYSELAKIDKKNPLWIYKKGLCYYNLNDFETALPLFDAYLKFKKHDDKAIFYTASSLHHTEQWERAAVLYKLYLKVTDTNSPDREEIKKLLMHCRSANFKNKEEIFALILNPGEPLNSAFNDLLPLQSSRFPDLLNFSSDRNGNFDIYSFNQQDSLKIRALSSRFNSKSDEILYAYPENGYQILYQMEKSVLIDNFEDENNENLSVPLFGFNSADFSDAYLFSDSLLFFVADLPGGMGGLDIYASIKKDGIWTKPLNLGNTVNSVFNERSPMICTDAKTLFFSSDRPESSGAYDVFKSQYISEQQNWTLPKVLSKPINSPGNDLFFRPGKTSAWICSIRNKGLGGFDNYMVYFREPLHEMQSQIQASNLNFLLNYLETSETIKTDILKEPINNGKDTLFYIQSFLYDSKLGNFENAAEKQLEQLFIMLSQYPTLKLVMTAHSDDSQVQNLSLLMTVNQAEKAAEVLIKRGISAKRILLRGCAGQYPQAKNKRFDGTPDKIGLELNNRIDIDIINSEQLTLRIENKQLMISSVMKDNLAEDYSQNMKGLSYKVQLAKSPTLFDHEIITQMRDAAAEKIPASSNVNYCIGLTKNFDAISIVFDTALEMGFSDASIVPYLDGFPMSEEDAKMQVSNYEDLQKFLNYKSKK